MEVFVSSDIESKLVLTLLKFADLSSVKIVESGTAAFLRAAPSKVPELRIGSSVVHETFSVLRTLVRETARSEELLGNETERLQVEEWLSFARTEILSNGGHPCPAALLHLQNHLRKHTLLVTPAHLTLADLDLFVVLHDTMKSYFPEEYSQYFAVTRWFLYMQSLVKKAGLQQAVPSLTPISVALPSIDSIFNAPPPPASPPLEVKGLTASAVPPASASTVSASSASVSLSTSPSPSPPLSAGAPTETEIKSAAESKEGKGEEKEEGKAEGKKKKKDVQKKMLTPEEQEALRKERQKAKEQKATAAAAAAPPPPPEIEPLPSLLDIRVGVMRNVHPHPDPSSTKLYAEDIDIGGGKVLSVCSGLREHIPTSELEGRKVIVIANMPLAVLKGVKSEGMVLCAVTGVTSANPHGDHVEMVDPPADSEIGQRVTFPGISGEPQLPSIEKSALLKLFKHMHIDSTGRALFKDLPLTLTDGYCTAAHFRECHMQ